LTSLNPQDQFVAGCYCKICGEACESFDFLDFNKFCDELNPFRFGHSGVNVHYVRCRHCGLIFTNFFDNWTDADWKRFVYNQDYVKVDKEYANTRPVHVAKDFARRLRGAEQARILDYGSGAGVFGDRMREQGFRHVECYDPFSSPRRPEGLFDIITCFEVIEHSPAPMDTLRDMAGLMADGGCILFSQTTQPDDILARRSGWWYLAPRNGHISVYTEETLVVMGRLTGLRFYRGDTVFGYADRQVSPIALLGLNSIGPAFEVVRLSPPSNPPAVDIAFPTPNDIWWHKTECAENARFRWTGRGELSWKVRWRDVSLLQLRVPYVAEGRPGFAAECTLTLDGVAAPTRMSRGEITAEFEVDGRDTGVVRLMTPEPVHDLLMGRKIGLAVPCSPQSPAVENVSSSS
jgi:SAM-dependent methyltransferase